MSQIVQAFYIYLKFQLTLVIKDFVKNHDKNAVKNKGIIFVNVLISALIV